MRLRSDIWVRAYIRRAEVTGASGYVMRRGDPDAGSILICISSPSGTSLLVPSAEIGATDDPGAATRTWREAIPAGPDSASLVKARLDRETGFDPDIWVVEIEDREGRHFLGDEFTED